MPKAYLIAVKTAGDAKLGLQRYVAVANTPEKAIEIVRHILATDADLHWTGEVLPPAIVTALRLRPGHARLV